MTHRRWLIRIDSLTQRTIEMLRFRQLVAGGGVDAR
jgi:hypothetical protein